MVFPHTIYSGWSQMKIGKIDRKKRKYTLLAVRLHCYLIFDFFFVQSSYVFNKHSFLHIHITSIKLSNFKWFLSTIFTYLLLKFLIYTLLNSRIFPNIFLVNKKGRNYLFLELYWSCLLLLCIFKEFYSPMLFCVKNSFVFVQDTFHLSSIPCW